MIFFQKRLARVLTKPTKGGSVSFVSTVPAHFQKIIEVNREQVVNKTAYE